MRALIIFACVAGVFTALERLWPARPQPLLRAGVVNDVGFMVLSVAVRFLLNGLLTATLGVLFLHAFPEHPLSLTSSPLWLQAVAVIVVLDFIFYVSHRLKHRWRWWWRLHETHHSSVELDWFSSVRFHPLEKILDRALYVLPLVLLGVSDEALLVLAGVDSLCAALCHSNLRVRIGPLIYLFNGPELHLWHHSAETSRQGCNFGNNLSIFDWMFGTAHLPPARPEAFGLPYRYPTRMSAQLAFAFRRADEPHDR